MTRLFPHPGLSFALACLWLLLNAPVTLNAVLFGALLGWGLPLLTAVWWPGRPRLRQPLRALEYVAVVLWDILRSNIVLARLVLLKPAADLRPAFIAIPLDLRQPEAISLLAGTITLTPGTLTADISTDGRWLLVHCLHAPDPDAVRAEIKQRYERRIERIFA